MEVPTLVDGRAEGVGVNWRPLIEFVVSVGYGLLSSVVPIFNSEIYIVASQVGGFTEEVDSGRLRRWTGHWQGRHRTRTPAGSRSNLVRRLRERRERPRKPAGRVRTKLRAWSDRLLGLLSNPGESSVAFLSACLAIPPLPE